MCNCNSASPQAPAPATLVSLTEMRSFLNEAGAALSSRQAPSVSAFDAMSPPDAISSFYVSTADGAGVATVANLDAESQTVFRGKIAFVDIEFHLSVALTDGVVVLTGELKKPFAAGPFVWKFGVGSGQPEPTASIAEVQASGISPGCMLDCGKALLPTVLSCLPTLASPPAFIACLTPKIVPQLPGIILCLLGCARG